MPQVFDHPEHVFQSSRCESELAASSTAEEANGHPPDLIAIAVHCVSLEGDAPRQVRIVENSILEGNSNMQRPARKCADPTKQTKGRPGR